MTACVRGLLMASLALVFLIGTGIAMPACPGQEALHKQMDELKAANADISKRLGAIEPQLKSSSEDLKQIKSVVSDVGSVLLSQRKEIAELQQAVKQLLEAQVNARAPASAPRRPPIRKR